MPNNIDISKIKVPASAYFYKKNDDVDIDKQIWKHVCRTIRDKQGISLENFIQKEWIEYTAVPNGEKAHFGLCAFRLPKSKASFAKDIRGFWDERKTGYAILIEYRGYVVLFKKNTPTLKPLMEVVTPVDYKRITTLYEKAVFTKVSMRNLDATEHALQNKSYEAKDLKISMPYIGASHYSIRSLSGEEDNKTFGIVPSTSRVRVAETKTLEECLDWAITTIEELIKPAPKNDFTALFAEAKDYSSSAAGIIPSSLLLHIGRIRELLTKEGVSLFYTGLTRVVDKGTLDAYINLLEERTMFLTPCSHEDEYITSQGDIILRKASQQIYLTNAFWEIISIESDGFNGTLEEYINEYQLFNVYFSDCSLIYSNYTLFQDNKLLGSKTLLLNALDDKTLNLNNVDSEKKGDDSIFARVESKFADGKVFLICDDFGTEWADHILVDEGRIVFFVEKWKEKSRQSASAFQDVVGQALKNLGNFTPTTTALGNKEKNLWNNPHPETQKNRLLSAPANKNSVQSAIDLWKTNMNNPLLQKEMCLVVNFISKDGFKSDLEKAEMNQEIKATTYQRLWILSSFINTCLDVGVKPIIYCAE